MFVAWVLFPVVLLAVCLGCGLLVEWAGGRRLPGGLLPAVGLALVVVAATLCTQHGATASATTPLVVVLALAGYALAWRRVIRLRPDPWMLAAAALVYAVCAAPVVLSGNATFLGYFVDSDPAFHFELISWLLSHGHNLTGVPAVSPSAVTNLLHEYIGTSYPVGADVAVGAVRPLVGQDVAWIYQPYLAVVMAMSPLALGAVLRDVVRPRPLRALCAFAIAQGGLVYAFYLETSVKEVVVVVLLSCVAVLIVDLLRRPLRLRSVIPLAVVVVAGLDVYSVAIAPWLALPLLVWLVVVVRRWLRVARRGWSWEAAAWPAAALVVLGAATPFIAGASVFATTANAVLNQQNALGNLAAPLSPWQILGIWPSGDFRFAPVVDTRTAFAFVGIATAGAALGAVWMLRRRAATPLLLLAAEGIAAAVLYGHTSPYAASKVLMIVSVPVLMTAVLGAAALIDSGRRPEGVLLGAAIIAGVVWTNFLAYHDSSVAPQARFRELAAIGTRFAGQGPALYDQWDTFAIYFLRQESVAVPDTYAGAAPLTSTTAPAHSFGQPSTPWDINELSPPYLQLFHLLVLGRSPVASHPPANFRLAYRGRYYDVWRRMPSPTVITHVPLGLSEGKASSCRAITAAATTAAGDHARLAYVTRPSPPTLAATTAQHPPAWVPVSSNGHGPSDVLALGQAAGRLTGTITVPRAGRYQVWLDGSFSRKVLVSVGGRRVGELIHQIGIAGQYLEVGTVELGAGPQPVTISRPPPTLTPGNVLGGDALGPLVLVADSAPPPVQEIGPDRARSLCGRSLEWVEVVRG